MKTCTKIYIESDSVPILIGIIDGKLSEDDKLQIEEYMNASYNKEILVHFEECDMYSSVEEFFE